MHKKLKKTHFLYQKLKSNSVNLKLSNLYPLYKIDIKYSVPTNSKSVEYCSGGQGVVGSNPAAPTIILKID